MTVRGNFSVSSRGQVVSISALEAPRSLRGLDRRPRLALQPPVRQVNVPARIAPEVLATGARGSQGDLQIIKVI